MANKYSKKIRLWAWNYDADSGKFSASVETNYLWLLEFTVEMYPSPKQTNSWGTIVGNLDVSGQQIAIRENDYNWNKRWSGTLSRDKDNKGNAWVNINKVISANPIKEYELVVVEKEQDGYVPSKDPEVRAEEEGLPF